MVPWAVLELPKLLHSLEPVTFDPIIMVSNAAAAFGLNMSVFLLIGKVRKMVSVNHDQVLSQCLC